MCKEHQDLRYNHNKTLFCTTPFFIPRHSTQYKMEMVLYATRNHILFEKEQCMTAWWFFYGYFIPFNRRIMIIYVKIWFDGNQPSFRLDSQNIHDWTGCHFVLFVDVELWWCMRNNGHCSNCSVVFCVSLRLHSHWNLVHFKKAHEYDMYSLCVHRLSLTNAMISQTKW